MEYVYAALLLHKLGKPVNAESITKIMQSAGAEVDEGKVKSLIASLKDVNIDEELEKAVVAGVAPATSGEAPAEEAPKEEKKEAAAEGLASLFG